MDEILKIGKDLPLLKSSVSIENLSPTVNLEGKKGKGVLLFGLAVAAVVILTVVYIGFEKEEEKN